jgi:integrase
VWEVRVSLGPDPMQPGRYRQKSRTVRGIKRDGDRVLAQLLVEANTGKHARSAASLAALLDRWLAFIDGRRSPTTMREYRRLVEQRIKPAFGDRPFAKLSAADLDDWYRQLEHSLSAASIRQIHAVIRRTYAQAVKWQLTDYNPAVHATPPTVDRKSVV